MPTDVTKVKQMLKLSEDKDRQGRLLMNESLKLREDAQKECPHPVIETNDSYDEGNYLDRASTTVTEKCAICGKLLNQKTKQHQWYG
jgi:hypothetical protein